MKIIWYFCLCGEPLVYDNKAKVYVPRRPEVPRMGHWPSAVMEDGKPRLVKPRPCEAPPSLDIRRAAKAQG